MVNDLAAPGERRNAFLAGEWTVEPELNLLRRGDIEHHIEPKVMKVLLTLAASPNNVIAKESLISAVWPDSFVSDDVLTRCISILRRVTHDAPQDPHFIQTISRRGYRLVAPIREFTAVREIPSAIPAERREDQQPERQSNQPSPIPSPAKAQPPAGTISLPSRWGAPRTLAAGIILAILIVAGLLVALLSRRPAHSDLPSSFRTVQLTSSADEQTQPAFSPDGKHVAYVRTSQDEKFRRIYLKEIGKETTRELTSNTEDDQQYSPTWSPDGRQIAYLSSSKNGLGLYVAEVGAGTAVKVFIPQEPSHWEQGALSWAPDGHSLIFPDHSGSQPDSSIYQLDLSSRKAHSITSPPSGWEGDLTPAWSPDGRWIAFTRASETAVRDIYWISVADGQLHQLTHDRMEIDSLAWNPFSNAIFFSSNRGGKYALWRMGLNQKQPVRMPIGTEDAFEPAVGSAGEFAYAQGTAIWSILRLQGDAMPQRDVMTRAAAQPVTVVSSTQQDSAPSLSPDGHFFAIQSLRSGSQEIWVSSIAGDSLHQLTSMGGPLTGSPSWSNGGDRILFDSRPDGHSHIFVIAAAGGKPRQLTFGNANDIVPRWSHGDTFVYFRSNRGGRWQLWKISATGGEPQPVTTGDGIEPQESADGKWLYYTRGDENGIWRVPTAGGAEIRVFDQPYSGYWGYWQLTPAGIFYLDLSGTSPSIRVLNTDTNPPFRRTSFYATLKQAPPLFAGLSVANAGRDVLVTERRDAGRHITLVEAY